MLATATFQAECASGGRGIQLGTSNAAAQPGLQSLGPDFSCMW